MTQNSSFRFMPTPTLITLATLAGLAFGFAGCSKPAETAVAKPAATPAIDSVEQKVSYGIGYNMGTNLGKQHDLQIDRDSLRAGIEDGMSGGKTRIPEADLQAAFTTIQQKVAAANAAAGEKQAAAGKDFLLKNRLRPGVTVTKSGLQYEVITKGPGGPKPKATDTVDVHYTGTLIDGTVFDSSVQRGTPATFRVGGVITGWIEALQLMSVGDKWKLAIPSELAYGARPPGGIPPNSVLLFEVQLLAIK